MDCVDAIWQIVTVSIVLYESNWAAAIDLISQNDSWSHLCHAYIEILYLYDVIDDILK